ncbi:MAG: hypothetical protein Q9165_003753 [Trypethelium subeluteriae]
MKLFSRDHYYLWLMVNLIETLYRTIQLHPDNLDVAAEAAKSIEARSPDPLEGFNSEGMGEPKSSQNAIPNELREIEPGVNPPKPLRPLLMFLKNPPQIVNLTIRQRLFGRSNGFIDKTLRQDVKCCEIFLMRTHTDHISEYAMVLGYVANFPLMSVDQTISCSEEGCQVTGEPYLINVHQGLVKGATSASSPGFEQAGLIIQWLDWDYANQVKDPLQPTYEDRKGSRARDDIWDTTVGRELKQILERGGSYETMRINMRQESSRAMMGSETHQTAQSALQMGPTVQKRMTKCNIL